MATFLEIQDEILNITGRPNLAAGAAFRARVKFLINRSYLALANGLDLPELQKNDTSITTVAATQNYSLPADCAFIHSISDTTNNVRLQKKGIAPLDAMGNAQLLPIWYGRFINEIHLAPVPNGAFGIRIRYLSRPVELSADGDTPTWGREWDQPLILLSAAYVALFTHQRDLAADFTQQFQALFGLMRIPGHALTLGADEGQEIIDANEELRKIGAPGTVPGFDTSGPTSGS